MTVDRIKEIQEKTAHPNSVSVQQALLQVWNECEQDNNKEQDWTNFESELMEQWLIVGLSGKRDLRVKLQ